MDTETHILHGRQSDLLDAWIDNAIESNIVPIMRFAQTLHRDIDAVRNAIELPWSNGKTEGQVNGLKTLKRANEFVLNNSYPSVFDR